MEKYNVDAKDSCKLVVTSPSKIAFLLNYSKSLTTGEGEDNKTGPNLN
ncbi:MAG: hypothetical protein R3299_12945 [Arenibacter sp.]|nr:hypothetical protein [Arenibacter sp.]